jgi:glycosyltransferase involved in cell wall biosynthesis
MKIAFILTDLESSGAKIVEHTIAKGLSSNHEIHIYCFKFSKSKEYPGIKYIQLPHVGKLRRATCVPYIIRELYANDYDYIFTVFDALEICIYLATAISNLLKIKKSVCVFTIHSSTDFMNNIAWRYKCINFAIYYINALLFHRLISVSAGVRDDWKKRFNIRKKINVLYNPVDEREIIQKSKDAISEFDISKKYIIAVGRLSKQKNYHNMLNAFARVRSSISDCNLLIIGDGPEKADLLRLAIELRIENYITWIDYTSNPYKFINNAEFLVLSSDYEGLPTVMIESLLLVKFIIATDCPFGPGEILSNGAFGRLVKVNDSFELANAILSQLSEYACTGNDASRLQKRGQFFSCGNIIPYYEQFIRGEYVDMSAPGVSRG